MVRIAANQQLDVLAFEGSLFAVGARNWIQFTLSLKKEGETLKKKKLYFGEGGDCTPLLGMPFKKAYRKKIKKKANASIHCNVRE